MKKGIYKKSELYFAVGDIVPRKYLPNSDCYDVVIRMNVKDFKEWLKIELRHRLLLLNGFRNYDTGERQYVPIESDGDFYVTSSRLLTSNELKEYGFGNNPSCNRAAIKISEVFLRSIIQGIFDFRFNKILKKIRKVHDCKKARRLCELMMSEEFREFE